MDVAAVPELDRFAWTHPLLPRHISVALCPAEAADDLDLVRFAPADATGATGLLLVLAADALCVPLDHIALHRPRPDDRFRSDLRPGTAAAGPKVVFTSLARTSGCIAAAVSRVPIGIDVERLQTQRQAHDLADLFHPADRAAIDQAEIGPAATAIWTRIEAGLKLRGTGLRRDPGTLRVGRGPEPLPFRRVQTLTAASAPDMFVSVAWQRSLLSGPRPQLRFQKPRRHELALRPWFRSRKSRNVTKKLRI